MPATKIPERQLNLAKKSYRATHSLSSTALTITHNLNLANPTEVIVQLWNTDNSNYYFSHKVLNHTANSLQIQLVAEAGPLNKIVVILG